MQMHAHAQTNVHKRIGEECVQTCSDADVAFENFQDVYTDCMQVHSSGEVLKLEPYCPWKTHLFSIEKTLSVSPSIKYMLYQESTSSKWRVQVYRDPVHMTLYGSGPLTILHTCGLRHTCRVYSLFAGSTSTQKFL